MNLNELILHLEDLRAEGYGELPVMFSYNYGDYWRTQVAVEVTEGGTGTVVHSPYHDMGKVVNVDEIDEEEIPAAARDVIILG